MFYGKYEEDEPSLAHKIARELSRRNDDDEVRLTASYCNSGDSDDYGYSHSHKEDNSPENKSFSDLQVGDVIKGLEHFGPIVAISSPSDYTRPEDTFSEKKIKKMRKWLEKKGFSYEGEYKGQHSYWMDSISLSVVTDPEHIIVNTEFNADERLFYTLAEAKSYIKEIIAIGAI